MASKQKKSTMKQGTLFSFFSKKPITPTDREKSPKPASTNSSLASKSTPKSSDTSSKNSQKPKNAEWEKVRIGSRLSVYWPDDKKYYDATVTKARSNNVAFHLEYDDGETEWLDLRQEKFSIITETDAGNQPAKKRRRIVTESDDDAEHEFEDGPSESDGSVYEHDDSREEEDEAMGDWIDEDDEVVASSQKRKAKQSFKVTTYKAPSSTPPSAKRVKSLTSNKASGATPKAFQSLRKVTPSSEKREADKGQPQRVVSSPPSKSSNSAKEALPYTKGAVNPAGSHVHNHLAFLRNPRDSAGRTRDQEGFDPRTLRVVPGDWEKHCSKMTAAVKQWWDLKSQYFDTVLLFKTGKFYEMFHMDADVGVEVLGLLYMKGHVAHAGFPEISYGTMADKLVSAGYKVARVEQTETPEMMKERKKKMRGSQAPKVVNREVCSILTMGTRTYCYLDNDKGLAEELGASGQTGIGPLLAIREVLLNHNLGPCDGDDAVKPVCEYGVVLVDAARAIVTVGQFADDVLRSRMSTLLSTYAPVEILLEAGVNGASKELESLIRSALTGKSYRVEKLQAIESFPKSTALDINVRRRLERRNGSVQPWNVDETIEELHRRKYYPRASREQQNNQSMRRWPAVLRALVEGKADLALSSFGATLYYLQRNLIDEEILSMGNVKAYIPPVSSGGSSDQNKIANVASIHEKADNIIEEGQPNEDEEDAEVGSRGNAVGFETYESKESEEKITHMALDGTALHNLEILTNSTDHKSAGSLWSKINHTKTPHGGRLLRAWLLRPLFQKSDIDRRVDAVEELISGAAAVAMNEATSVLSKCGDIERLLTRIHAMSGNKYPGSEDDAVDIHPNARAILYETKTYTKRKVGDFSTILKGLRAASQIPEIFSNIDLRSGLLRKIVRLSEDGGCFPHLTDEIDWFFEHLDFEKASRGLFEPGRGIDQAYDEACDEIEDIVSKLNDYKNDMCSNCLTPRNLARSSWKYINTGVDSKDKYLIELPINVSVPDDFLMKGKRGSGKKQVNKYRSQVVEQLVKKLEHAIEVQKERKARQMQLIFAKFDTKRTLWEAAAKATALLDALASLAQTSSKSGYVRPTIMTCPPDKNPTIEVKSGCHPCVEVTPNSNEFIPNDLYLGSQDEKHPSRILLLSGPNMGGKSTLLRQTCLIAILAQIGCFVPAEECALTPVDRIYTRLGASDRILLGQSTFFVELAETAAALRGATRRSLVIMDELGRGTSTFDGTAIASATVKHLVESNRCLSLFATHYHSLLDEWKLNPTVRLGHMECIVEEGQDATNHELRNQSNITFLYTLGDGACPRSFGINVARLACLPDEVLRKAKSFSSNFEHEMNAMSTISLVQQQEQLVDMIVSGNWDEVETIWKDETSRTTA